ncbi:MAG: ABC transporter substrate-binding protein [Deinococcales bacterium]
MLGLLTWVSAQDLPKVHAGLEATGTFSWITFAIDHYGIDTELGFDLETVIYATKQAKELALRAGESDVVVDDFLGPVLWKQQGIAVSGVYPYSLATGGVVVAEDSGINSIADLKGKKIMASSLRDKSLLILRALAVAHYGFDPQEDSEILEGAPPLMIELINKGEVDAVIPFWHIVARLTAGGQNRELVAATAMLDELGLSSDLPILMLAARDEMDRELLGKFIMAMNTAIERMQEDEGFWQLILDNELYSLPDPSQFPNVVARWQVGIPSVWNQDVVDGLVNVVETMVELAGAEVVGVEAVDPAAYSLEFATP